MKTRRLDLDVLRGYAITLVVFGHLADAGPDTANEWYSVLKSFVYLFHMSIFMFVSGFLTQFSMQTHWGSTFWNRFAVLVQSRVRVIVPLYLALVVAVLCGSVLLRVKGGGSPEWDVVGRQFWIMVLEPLSVDGASFRQLWFLQAILALTITGPLLVKSFRGIAWAAFAVAVVVYFAPLSVTRVLSLHLVWFHLPMFLLGVTMAQLDDTYLSFVERWGYTFLLPLAAIFAFCCATRTIDANPLVYRAVALLAAVSSVACLHKAARTNTGRTGRLFAALG